MQKTELDHVVEAQTLHEATTSHILQFFAAKYVICVRDLLCSPGRGGSCPTTQKKFGLRKPTEGLMCSSNVNNLKQKPHIKVTLLNCPSFSVCLFVYLFICCFFYSKGLKTEKLPAHTFEVDEDAKDEVSGWILIAT